MNRRRSNFGSYSRIISEIYREQKIKSRAELRKESIEIDLSRLDSIRSDAAFTRERLMTDEERYVSDPAEQQVTEKNGQDDLSGLFGMDDALWGMYDEYTEEDSADIDQFS